MGIPSYYKTLCDRIPGLLGKRIPEKPTHFWVDFNCMIYHCIRRPDIAIYTDETRLQWENDAIDAVCKYMKKLIGIIQPTELVYIGVDGVVPMAKIRQQRLRRFKSYWTALEEQRIGVRGGESRWDTNAITPGTAFMERLGVALHLMAKGGGGPRIIVSAADEPGEGEQKLMRELRGGGPMANKSHVIYGLDADLIVLGLLLGYDKVWLFREAAETGVKKPSKSPSLELSYKICGDVATSDEEYSYFSIQKLSKWAFDGQDDSYRLDYCMGMSLLGNDFLPHSMSVKLKEGGHEVLLNMLSDCRQAGNMCTQDSWNKEGLIQCFAYLARNEQQSIELSVLDKIKNRHQRTRGATSKEHAQDEWNKTPLRMCDELALMESGLCLRADWRAVYYERYLGITSQKEIDNLCKQYCRGLQWIHQYYLGGAVNLSWHFPWFLPPLWADLAGWLGVNELPEAPRGPVGNVVLKPQEQLALVLPIQSYWLVRDPKLRQLPKKLPQFWPSGFELFTAGHKQMWECETCIPILTPERLCYALTSS